MNIATLILIATMPMADGSVHVERIADFYKASEPICDSTAKFHNSVSTGLYSRDERPLFSCVTPTVAKKLLREK